MTHETARLYLTFAVGKIIRSLQMNRIYARCTTHKNTTTQEEINSGPLHPSVLLAFGTRLAFFLFALVLALVIRRPEDLVILSGNIRRLRLAVQAVEDILVQLQGVF